MDENTELLRIIERRLGDMEERQRAMSRRRPVGAWSVAAAVFVALWCFVISAIIVDRVIEETRLLDRVLHPPR